ncbi:MAG: hypothetical protein K8T26_09080 [Lentisphaerae bacterium]|nr:hypothetical protein [Lentisphaerota bacterium]
MKNSHSPTRGPGDSKPIPGIYNYCDRWCERCAMTSRCAIYDSRRERHRHPGAGAASDSLFWKELGDTMSQTLKMVSEMAAKHGINLDEAEMNAYTREASRRRESTKTHPLARLSRDYENRVDAWFRAHEPLVQETVRARRAIRTEALTGHRPEHDAAAIEDGVEVILWHQHQIHTKLMRALLHEPSPAEHPGDPTDADGSAKVALLGMDHSIAAWGRLCAHLPPSENAILDLLVQLTRLRRLTEREFPKARTFVRPGFDAR